ncbi:MAG TPA: hypothetical protein VN608_05060 [Clostridia bacterium]|nr:hypothetical protein [Clostridia bacterium]
MSGEKKDIAIKFAYDKANSACTSRDVASAHGFAQALLLTETISANEFITLRNIADKQYLLHSIERTRRKGGYNETTYHHIGNIPTRPAAKT